MRAEGEGLAAAAPRIIAPITEGWDRGERDWSYVVDPRQAIEAWEARTGLALPDGFRRFMLAFNGGRPHPRLFRYTVPLERYPSTEPVTQLAPLYSWASVEAHWRGEVYGSGTPRGMLLIGCDPGGLEVLLSLRPEDAGQIFTWVHTTAPWGTEDNDQIWHQADSFEAFLDSLFDWPDGSDYRGWRVPIFDRLARPLVF